MGYIIGRSIELPALHDALLKLEIRARNLSNLLGKCVLLCVMTSTHNYRKLPDILRKFLARMSSALARYGV